MWRFARARASCHWSGFIVVVLLRGGSRARAPPLARFCGCCFVARRVARARVPPRNKQKDERVRIGRARLPGHSGVPGRSNLTQLRVATGVLTDVRGAPVKSPPAPGSYRVDIFEVEESSAQKVVVWEHYGPPGATPWGWGFEKMVALRARARAYL